MNILAKCGLTALVVLAAVTPAAAADTVEFTLINASTHTIAHFYTGPTSSDDWGDDLLSGATIVPGEQGTVTINAEDCTYDMRFETEDGGELEARALNVCELNSYTIND
jgi:hypothetical protein